MKSEDSLKLYFLVKRRCVLLWSGKEKVRVQVLLCIQSISDNPRSVPSSCDLFSYTVCVHMLHVTVRYGSQRGKYAVYVPCSREYYRPLYTSMDICHDDCVCHRAIQSQCKNGSTKEQAVNRVK